LIGRRSKVHRPRQTRGAERNEWHRDALDACLKVLEGHRSTIDAERAFREAVQRARILGRPADD
jgi:hypothetical protein